MLLKSWQLQYQRPLTCPISHTSAKNAFTPSSLQNYTILFGLQISSDGHLAPSATAVLVAQHNWCRGISVQAFVIWLAGALLSKANQALTLSCAFSSCVLRCCLYCHFCLSRRQAIRGNTTHVEMSASPNRCTAFIQYIPTQLRSNVNLQTFKVVRCCTKHIGKKIQFRA